MLIKTFNWWTVCAPLGLLLAFLTGYVSVRRKLCRVHAPKTVAPYVVNAIAAAIIFGAMVTAESYVGILDLAIRTAIAPGESEAWADGMTCVAIAGATFVYGVIYVCFCFIGEELHRKIARVGTRHQREVCRRAKKDYQLMETICGQCKRAHTGYGYCPVGHITSEYEAKPRTQDDDLPELTEVERDRIEAAKAAQQSQSEHCTPTVKASQALQADPGMLRRRRRSESPKVNITAQQATTLRTGLAQARKIFAEQSAAGLPCACVLMIQDCPVRYNCERPLEEEELQEWNAFLDAQTKASSLPSVG